jgi:hypothetical protein
MRRVGVPRKLALGVAGSLSGFGTRNGTLRAQEVLSVQGVRAESGCFDCPDPSRSILEDSRIPGPPGPPPDDLDWR